MRRFHLLKNREHCPIVNLDKLWSMLPAGTLEEAKAAGGKAPIVDVTDQVRRGVSLVVGCFFFQYIGCLLYTSPSPRD